MHVARLFSSALICLALAACTAAPPATPTPEPSLYMVSNGPHPLYASEIELASARARTLGIAAAQSEQLAIQAGRIARAERHFDPQDSAWLLHGCIFDVQSTSPDQLEPSYVWAYGRVVRCAEPVEDDVLEPQMGVRPNKLWVYDGREGYFPMHLLDPYTANAPAATR